MSPEAESEVQKGSAEKGLYIACRALEIYVVSLATCEAMCVFMCVLAILSVAASSNCRQTFSEMTFKLPNSTQPTATPPPPRQGVCCTLCLCLKYATRCCSDLNLLANNFGSVGGGGINKNTESCVSRPES